MRRTEHPVPQNARTSNGRSRDQGQGNGLLRLLIPLAILLSFAPLNCGVPSRGTGPLGPGAAMPPIRAEGWLNGDAGVAANLRGSVVVVAVWAYW
jgi:hypothetical protein